MKNRSDGSEYKKITEHEVTRLINLVDIIANYLNNIAVKVRDGRDFKKLGALEKEMGKSEKIVPKN
jgi:hypothetical protein